MLYCSIGVCLAMICERTLEYFNDETTALKTNIVNFIKISKIQHVRRYSSKSSTHQVLFPDPA